LKATDILAVQMLKFIGSFYWLYKALKHSLGILRFKIVRCVVVLCVDETYCIYMLI
jgi:hypothetical protein